MIPWELLDRAPVPGNGGELCLYRRGKEFSIRADGRELMNSLVHGSEEALAELACDRIADGSRTRVLVGGLGMGFTLAAALQRLGARARVVVAELVPAVVTWNRGLLGELAGDPLSDRRVTVRVTDVAEVLRGESQGYDAILLDVDNGPEGLTRQGNDWLYGRPGLAAASAALRPRGVLAVWSSGPDQDFLARLRQMEFAVDEIRVRGRSPYGRGRYTIWIARR
jgi:spermidine synthase